MGNIESGFDSREGAWKIATKFKEGSLPIPDNIGLFHEPLI